MTGSPRKKGMAQFLPLRAALYSLVILCAVLGVAQDEQRERAQFQDRYLQLEPPEQVRMWLKQKPSDYAADMENILIARGESARYMAAIVRNPKESLYQRWRAMKLLCDMDRYVPVKEFPVPAREEIYLPRLNLSGVINRNAPVNGQRIGKEAYEALQWAASQTRSQEVRFHARDLLGLLDEDLHAMPLRRRFSAGQRLSPEIVAMAAVLQHPTNMSSRACFKYN